MPVILEFDGRTAVGEKGVSLQECLRRAGICGPSSCHGQGRCGECRVRIEEGGELLSPAGNQERGGALGWRLACQAVVTTGEGRIRGNLREPVGQRIEAAGRRGEIPWGFDPAVRVEAGAVLLEGREIDRYRGGVFGAALDLGTSTVVIRFVNLATGEEAASDAFINPQYFAGSDVMSRISYASGQGSTELRQALVRRLNLSISESGIPADSIYELVVSGNPAMRDIFFGFDVSGLGRSPFHSHTERELRAGIRKTTAVYLSPASVGLAINPGGRIYGLPLPGCHVGGDIAAGVLLTGLEQDARNAVLLDLGTNSEIVISCRGELAAASCPAGPAFEGGRIKCGMPGLPGAVEAVRILPGSTIALKTIGGLPPAGLCGSGLISLLGELLENGLINNRGRFTRTTEAGSSAFPVSGDHGRPAAEDREGGDYHVEPLAFQFPGQGIKKLMIGGGGEISVDEEDLSQLLQAKAAVTAGIRIALRRFGLRCRDLEVCYLAGAFGRYLSLESASAIGLVPRLEPDTFRRLGNSSIEGAVLALLSVSARAGLERTVGKIIHLELESEPDFFELYTEGCLLEAIPDA